MQKLQELPCRDHPAWFWPGLEKEVFHLFDITFQNSQYLRNFLNFQPEHKSESFYEVCETMYQSMQLENQ